MHKVVFPSPFTHFLDKCFQNLTDCFPLPSFTFEVMLTPNGLRLGPLSPRSWDLVDTWYDLTLTQIRCWLYLPGSFPPLASTPSSVTLPQWIPRWDGQPLTDSEGNTVEFNWTSEEEPVAPWGDVILACFLVWIVTLSASWSLPLLLVFRTWWPLEGRFVPTCCVTAAALFSLATSLISPRRPISLPQEQTRGRCLVAVVGTILLGLSPSVCPFLLAGLSYRVREKSPKFLKDKALTTVEMVADDRFPRCQ